MTRLRSPQDEIEELHAKTGKGLAADLALIQRARIAGNLQLMERRLERLGKRLGSILAAADLLGRRRLLLELRAAGLLASAGPAPVTGAQFAAFEPQEAIDDILSRNPVLAQGWEATADAWATRGFALARSASLTVTSNVQDLVVRFLRGGLDMNEAQAEVGRQLTAGGTAFSRAYTETVFRTITSGAYQAGRKTQAAKPAVQRVASGWRYQATLDADVRDNHRAGDNFVAHTQDPIWVTLSPPNGFNCRCTVEFVPTDEMIKLGLSHEDGSLARFQQAPLGFVPDPGFTRKLRA